MRIIDNIRSKLVSKLTGITLHYAGSDEFSASYITVGLEKGETSVLDSNCDLTSLDELTTNYDAKIPVWLTITGRHVITRRLEENPGENYLNHILPNVREEDFLVTISPTGTKGICVSAIRLEVFDEIINELREKGILILGISLGPVPLSLLNASELLPNGEFIALGYNIQLANGVIEKLETTDKQTQNNYPIGDEVLETSLLIPFATALSYLVNHAGVDRLIGDNFISNEQDYKGKKINQWALYSALGLLFVILLINFFSFSIINSKHQELSGKLSYQQAFFAQKDSLQKELNVKMSMVEQMGLSEDTEFGFYVDRIAATVPQKVGLEILQLNPIKDKVRSGEAVEFENGILIEGSSQGSIVLNEWIVHLKEYDWVSDINIIRYEKVEQKGNFALTISCTE